MSAKNLHKKAPSTIVNGATKLITCRKNDALIFLMRLAFKTKATLRLPTAAQIS
jgi:hypothetical protein